MMPVPSMRQPIASPTPIKPTKRGFSIEELVGPNRATDPKFQSSVLVKPETSYNYHLMPTRNVAESVIDPLTHYTQMYSRCPPEERTNIDYFGPVSSSLHPLSLLLGGRDMQPMHPWFVNRPVRYYHHPRIHGPESAAYLYHPFRKPKRIRTAFSPTQLLQLERSFEKNHYVVGSERRQLAEALQLTETQVKVWFQNRRTKHKRQKQDDDQSCDDKAGDSQEHSSSDEESTTTLQDRNSGINDEIMLWNSTDAKVSTLSNVSYTPQYNS